MNSKKVKEERHQQEGVFLEMALQTLNSNSSSVFRPPVFRPIALSQVSCFMTPVLDNIERAPLTKTRQPDLMILPAFTSCVWSPPGVERPEVRQSIFGP